MLSGDEWYFLEATRAVNQAIGRVIRHKDDYGAILLCDYRFNQPRQKAQLSSWIQGHLNQAQPTTFGPMIGAVSRFFRNAERTVCIFCFVWKRRFEIVLMGLLSSLNQDCVRSIRRQMVRWYRLKKKRFFRTHRTELYRTKYQPSRKRICEFNYIKCNCNMKTIVVFEHMQIVYPEF